jgi:hypothetical protein
VANPDFVDALDAYLGARDRSELDRLNPEWMRDPAHHAAEVEQAAQQLRRALAAAVDDGG